MLTNTPSTHQLPLSGQSLPWRHYAEAFYKISAILKATYKAFIFNIYLSSGVCVPLRAL